MENNIKTRCNGPIHIEFYGLPGCGKSTVSHNVAERLRSEGYKIFEPTYEMDHEITPFVRKIKKIMITVCFGLTHYSEFRYLRFFVRNCGNKNFGDLLRHMVNIVPKYSRYLSAKEGVHIWDEGMIQSSISLAIGDCSNEINKKLGILIQNNQIIPVYLVTDIQTALKRMEKRLSNDSRVEKEKNFNKKIEMMLHYESIIKKIKFEQYVECSTDINSEEYVLEKIKSLF